MPMLRRRTRRSRTRGRPPAPSCPCPGRSAARSRPPPWRRPCRSPGAQPSGTPWVKTRLELVARRSSASCGCVAELVVVHRQQVVVVHDLDQVGRAHLAHVALVLVEDDHLAGDHRGPRGGCGRRRPGGWGRRSPRMAPVGQMLAQAPQPTQCPAARRRAWSPAATAPRPSKASTSCQTPSWHSRTHSPHRMQACGFSLRRGCAKRGAVDADVARQVPHDLHVRPARQHHLEHQPAGAQRARAASWTPRRPAASGSCRR